MFFLMITLKINTTKEYFHKSVILTQVISSKVHIRIRKKSFCQVLENKTAQRAMGHSHDEKVKDHSGAIYRGPLMLSTKYW